MAKWSLCITKLINNVYFFVPPSVSIETSVKIDEFEEKNFFGRRHNTGGLVF
jgi:hypothetical protein